MGLLSKALGWTILHSLWQGMLIAIITAIILLFLREKKAQVRYRTTGISMLAMLLVAIGTFYWYATPKTAPNDAIFNQNVDNQFITTNSLEPSAVPNTTLTTPSSEGIAFSMGAWMQKMGQYFDPHLGFIALIWCFGCMIYLLRLLSNIGQVYYLKKQRNFPADEYWAEIKDELLRKAGIAKAVELVESTLVRTPVVIGHIKPFIMFPIGLINRLDPFEVEAIIAHEIAHIVRRDYLFNILQSLVETLFYFHPAVWWMSATMRREREIAADEMAIALTGNAVNYAKALVVVQELAHFPMSMALAFAGNKKSQFFTRIQYILKTNHSKYFAMEKFISAGVFLLLMVGLALAQNGPNASPKPMNKPQFTTADSTKGIWVAEVLNGQLCLTITRKSPRSFWTTDHCYDRSEFSALPNGKGSFTMTREAGTITFDGELNAKEGYGRFVFLPNPNFVQMLNTKNIQKVEEDMYIHFCLNNVTAGYIDFVKNKGFKNLDGEDLVGLAVHGLNTQEIDQYMRVFEEKGRKNVNIEDLMAFKIHDITEGFIDSLSNIGFKNLSTEDIMSAKIHGMNARFIQECVQMGYPNLPFDQALSFKIHGISPAYVANLKKSGISNLSADDLMSFKIHDVSAEYIARLKNMGWNVNDHDAILSHKIHNITPEYAASMKATGINLSQEDLVAYKIHDITPEYIQSMKAAGFNMDAETLLSFKIHHITPAYAAEMKAAGFNLNDDDLLSFKIHDVTPDFIETYKKIGFSNIKPDDALSLKIHGVTPDFIEQARQKGFKDMTIEEYIHLKIQFGDKIRQ